MEAKESQKAWEEKADIIAATAPCQNPNCGLQTRRTAALISQYLTAYKASLREAIENYHKAIDSELDNNTIEKQAALESLDKVLKLLDTVNPKN